MLWMMTGASKGLLHLTLKETVGALIQCDRCPCQGRTHTRGRSREDTERTRTICEPTREASQEDRCLDAGLPVSRIVAKQLWPWRFAVTTDRRRKTRAWFLDSGLHIVVLEENGAQPHCGLTQGQHGSSISHFGWSGHVPGAGWCVLPRELSSNEQIFLAIGEKSSRKKKDLRYPR
ncbi:uncharacterized protein LOC144613787 [Panthera onca]